MLPVCHMGSMRKVAAVNFTGPREHNSGIMHHCRQMIGHAVLVYVLFTCRETQGEGPGGVSKAVCGAQGWRQC